MSDLDIELERFHTPLSRTVEFTWIKTGVRDSRVETECAACAGDDTWPCLPSRLIAEIRRLEAIQDAAHRDREGVAG